MELVDRSVTSVGPIRVEVIERLKSVRVVARAQRVGPRRSTCDGTAPCPAYEEPRHFIRKHGRVMFDTMRFAQTGYWTGEIHVEDETIEVTPDRWKGTRDRSWGVRPVGEAEPAGIHADDPSVSGFWNYAPMQFDDYSILYMVQEPDWRRAGDGRGDPHLERPRPRARVARPSRARPHLRARAPGWSPRRCSRSPTPPAVRSRSRSTPLVDSHIGIGTGYGMDADWRHGM